MNSEIGVIKKSIMGLTVYRSDLLSVIHNNAIRTTVNLHIKIDFDIIDTIIKIIIKPMIYFRVCRFFMTCSLFYLLSNF